MEQEPMMPEETIELDAQTAEEDKGEDGFSYPFDPNRMEIHLREDPQSVFQFIRKAQRNELILDPDFQRNLVWKPEQKSRFIESILLNFPVPPLYVNEDSQGRWVMIDGLQRTSTLRDFMADQFALKGLTALEKLNGSRFSELPQRLQSKIEDKKLSLYILASSTPIRIIYELFDRINTGGTPLNRQEVRHCILKGKATELLQKLAAQENFRLAIDGGVSPTRMKDREVVLRYLAFRVMHYKDDYHGDLSDFVEKAMDRINKMTDEQIAALETDFNKVMRLTYAFFGQSNFRMPAKGAQGQVVSRGTINTSMLESVGAFFSDREEGWLLAHQEQIKANFQELLSDQTYTDAVRFSTGSRLKVARRFEIASQLLGKGL